MNKKTVYLLFTVLLVAFAACKEDSTVFYSLNKTDLAIHPKETFQFAVWEQSMDFNRVYAGSITWSVIDQVPIEPAHTEVARIDETGLLTAVNPGQAIVKAACANGYTVMSAITVNAWDAPDASDASDGLSASTEPETQAASAPVTAVTPGEAPDDGQPAGEDDPDENGSDGVYIVEEGDTLAIISKKMYGDVNHVDAISTGRQNQKQGDVYDAKEKRISAASDAAR